MSNLNTHLERHPGGQWNVPSRQILSGLMILTLSVASISIVKEDWLLLAGAVAIPLFFLWPVQMSLGTFALLLPFDSVAALGTSSAGTTLNWFIGALTAVILFGMGLVNRRLERPPRAAIWWVIFMTWTTVTVLWALEPAKALQRLPTVFALVLLYVVAVSFRMTRREFSGIVCLTIPGGMVAAGFPL